MRIESADIEAEIDVIELTILLARAILPTVAVSPIVESIYTLIEGGSVQPSPSIYTKPHSQMSQLSKEEQYSHLLMHYITLNSNSVSKIPFYIVKINAVGSAIGIICTVLSSKSSKLSSV